MGAIQGLYGDCMGVVWGYIGIICQFFGAYIGWHMIVNIYTL